MGPGWPGPRREGLSARLTCPARPSPASLVEPHALACPAPGNPRRRPRPACRVRCVRAGRRGALDSRSDRGIDLHRGWAGWMVAPAEGWNRAAARDHGIRLVPRQLSWGAARPGRFVRAVPGTSDPLRPVVPAVAALVLA